MSKKKKRQARRTTTKEAPPSTGAAKARRRSEPEFNPDYSYVIKDLKRIGALAGTFIVFLFVLAFFLN